MEIKYKNRIFFSQNNKKENTDYFTDNVPDKNFRSQDLVHLLSKIPKEIECAKNYIESEFQVKLVTHESKPKFFFISKSEKLLASFSQGSVLTLWNLETYALICIVKLDYPRIVSAVFMNDEKQILFTSNLGNLDYFHVDSKEVVPFHKVSSKVDLVSVSYDGSLIWYCTFESRHVFINTQGFIIYQNSPAPIITSAIFSKFSNTLYSATIFGNICLYVTGDRFSKKIIKINLKIIKSIVLTPDEQLLCLVQNDQNITIMELNRYTIIREFNEINLYLPTKIEQNSIINYYKFISQEYSSFNSKYQTNINSIKTEMDESVPLVFLNHTNSILYANYQGGIKCLNFDNLQSNLFLSSHSLGVSCFLVAANGSDLITGGADGTIRVWDLSNKSEIFILFGNHCPVYLLFLTFDKKKLVSVNYESDIFVWDSTNYLKIQKFREHKLKITSLSCDYTSQFIVSASYDSTIKIWSIQNGDCLKSIEIKNIPDSNFSTKNNKYHVDIYFNSKFQMFRVWRFFNLLIS